MTAKCGGGTDSDGSSPISPSKQSRITSYFASKQGRREKENLILETGALFFGSFLRRGLKE